MAARTLAPRLTQLPARSQAAPDQCDKSFLPVDNQIKKKRIADVEVCDRFTTSANDESEKIKRNLCYDMAATTLLLATNLYVLRNQRCSCVLRQFILQSVCAVSDLFWLNKSAHEYCFFSKPELLSGSIVGINVKEGTHA